MFKLLKISYVNVKNIIFSKESLLLISASFLYSIMWVAFVHPKSFGAVEYSTEFSRFLYMVILYMSVSILRNDIKSNVTKTIFTGIFTRVQIMFSKIISLILLSLFVSILIEINNLLVSILLHDKIGFSGFLNINHLHIIANCSVVTFCMGALMLLIISIVFNEKKSILFFILFLSTINFYNAGFITMAYRDPLFMKQILTYSKTPFYICTDLMMNLGGVNMYELLMALGYGLIFSAFSILVVSKKEIK